MRQGEYKSSFPDHLSHQSLDKKLQAILCEQVVNIVPKMSFGSTGLIQTGIPNRAIPSIREKTGPIRRIQLLCCVNLLHGPVLL